MSIKYNNKTIAGYYKTEIIPNADTVNAGKIRIATQAEVDSGESNSTAVTPSYLSKKQDKLTAGKNITIENGVISADTTTGINVDGETISNENAVLSSIGTKTKSNTIKIDWEGTEAEYEAGLADGTISNDWYCYITDDETVVDFADHTELEVQNMYKTGNVSTDTTGYNQLVQMKHSTFDLSKFTVVGSPTITDDGVASGLSSSNFVKIPFNSTGYQNFKIKIPFKLIGQTIANNHIARDGAGGFGTYYFGNDGFKPYILGTASGEMYASEYLQQGVEHMLVIEVKNDVNVIFDVVKTTNNINILHKEWVTARTKEIDFVQLSPITFLQSDLSKFSIEVDGKEVFSGNKTGIDVINDIEIPYTQSKTGSKIVDVAYRDRVIDLYEQEGQAGYYTIDEDNKNFTLPMGEIYGMIESKADKDMFNNPFSLFDSKYSDHKLNNSSWLKSEGQWNAKAVYPDAYNELLTEYNNSASVNKTEGSITFKRTPKGYKIALADQETAIDTKYTTDGIAWYYILDTTNEKFKLPRTKFGFEGLRTSVGDDIKAGLPNITGTLGVNPDRNVFNGSQSGAFYRDGSGGRKWAAIESTANSLGDIHFDASRSNPIYGNSNTVQPPATQMYLYFYVGETVQNANLIDAGRIGEQLAGKVDLDAQNFSNEGKSTISSWSFPSDKYIDLTLGASGTTYTAPADGWVYYYASSTTGNTAHNAYCRLEQGGRPAVELRAQPRINFTTDTKSTELLCFLTPVIRGNFIIKYRGFNAQEANSPYFRFYYTVGSEPLA